MAQEVYSIGVDRGTLETTSGPSDWDMWLCLRRTLHDVTFYTRQPVIFPPFKDSSTFFSVRIKKLERYGNIGDNAIWKFHGSAYKGGHSIECRGSYNSDNRKGIVTFFSTQDSESVWNGYLAPASYGEIWRRLHHLLDGRRYAFIATSDKIIGFKPDIALNQELNTDVHPSGNAIITYCDEDHAEISIVDTYGTRTIRPYPENGAIDAGMLPYFEFRHGCVTITHRSQSGENLCWTIIVQGDSRDRF